MIKNLIFDFGRVLVDYDFDHIVDTFFSKAEDACTFKGLVCSQTFIDKCDREDIPFADLIAEMQKAYPRWEKELQLFYDHYLDYVTGEVPGMRALLQKYREQGYRLYGLTNWCSKVHEVIEKYDILRMLDGRVVSSEEHLIKPDVAIYRRLCEKYGLCPEECVFTDDRIVNVEGAQSAGMQAVLFENAAQLDTELHSLLAEPLLNEHNKEEYAPAHTAEHILNRTMVNMFGCERSKNAHIERKKSKINFLLADKPTEMEVADIQERINSVISDDIPIRYEFADRNHIPEGVKLDKLPEDASETLRMVWIGDYDVCPCIGKHVTSTAEIGRFVITSTSWTPIDTEDMLSDGRKIKGSFRIVFRVIKNEE